MRTTHLPSEVMPFSVKVPGSRSTASFAVVSLTASAFTGLEKYSSTGFLLKSSHLLRLFPSTSLGGLSWPGDRPPKFRTLGFCGTGFPPDRSVISASWAEFARLASLTTYESSNSLNVPAFPEEPPPPPVGPEGAGDFPFPPFPPLPVLPRRRRRLFPPRGLGAGGGGLGLAPLPPLPEGGGLGLAPLPPLPEGGGLGPDAPLHWAADLVGAGTWLENCPPMLPPGPYWHTRRD